MNHHRYSFFGQKTGLILDSGEQCEISSYFTFLKKKADNSWEKLSNHEGKCIKLNMLELIAIIDICNHSNQKWSTVHKYSNDSTPITFENQEGVINISIPGYNKQIRYPENNLFVRLLSHILEEKIINATGKEIISNGEEISNIQEENVIKPSLTIDSIKKDSNNDIPENPFEPELPMSNPDPNRNLNNSHQSQPISNNVVPSEKTSLIVSSPSTSFFALEKLQRKGEFYLLPGSVLATRPKAVQFKMVGQTAFWIPLSVVNELDDASKMGGIWIKEWFARKLATQGPGEKVTAAV
jgi:hypothetical protein